MTIDGRETKVTPRLSPKLLGTLAPHSFTNFEERPNAVLVVDLDWL